MDKLVCITDGLKSFTKGVAYRVVDEHDFYHRVTVIDDVGDHHNLSGYFLDDNFKKDGGEVSNG